MAGYDYMFDYLCVRLVRIMRRFDRLLLPLEFRSPRGYSLDFRNGVLRCGAFGRQCVSTEQAG